MLKPLIRTLDGWRFELPLALVLGASVAFAVIAMPWSPFAGVTGRGLQHALDWLLAAVLALVAGYVAYRAMAYPYAGTKVATQAEPEAEDEEAPPIDVSLRLRRSDAHPDFPPRVPIIASRDLGEPFMDIVGFDDGAVDAPLGNAGLHALNGAYADLPTEIPEAIKPEIPAEERAAIEPEPVAEIVAPVEADIVPPAEITPVETVTETLAPPLRPLTLVEDSDADSPIAAFTPESAIEPAPQPERARRESLGEMMERLSAGLERRAGRPVAPPPADMLADALARPRAATPELRDALDHLNRLAGRR